MGRLKVVTPQPRDSKKRVSAVPASVIAAKAVAASAGGAGGDTDMDDVAQPASGASG